MAEFVGYQKTALHKTKILPLRWIVNSIFHPISIRFLTIGINANDRFTYEYSTYKFRHFLMESIGYRLYVLFDLPYRKWGTTYKIDFPKDFKLDDGLGWDDYDEFGVPYWEYFWHEDPVTGDAWRLVEK